MKRLLGTRGRTWVLAAIVAVVLGVFVWVALRAGPMAPVAVTVGAAEPVSITPAAFGTGTVEARYIQRVGATSPGRLRSVSVQVGDRVRAGQVLAEIDPVDLDERLSSQAASLRRAEANARAAEAQLEDMAGRARHAESQLRRYEPLLASGAVSIEMVDARRNERDIAAAALRASRASLAAAQEDLARLQADHRSVARQRASLRLVASMDALVTAREAEPGTTVVAGQTVVELVDPQQLWIAVRFDQASAAGLRAGLPVTAVLRSRPRERLTGRVLRVEPRADAVTEELLAKVVIDTALESLPPLGELAEVTTTLPPLDSALVVPNASVQRRDGSHGVWVVDGHSLRWRPVRLGASDLDGRVQVLEGLTAQDRVVVYSERALGERSRIRIVPHLEGAA